MFSKFYIFIRSLILEIYKLECDKKKSISRDQNRKRKKCHLKFRCVENRTVVKIMIAALWAKSNREK